MFVRFGQVGRTWRAVIRLLARFRRTPIQIDERRLRHIFRNAEGHFADDTPENRSRLLRVARDPARRLGVDRFGILWAEETMPDESQIWVQIKDRKVINGGLNLKPRAFDVAVGLSIRQDTERNLG
jgi:hypothetical protein